MYVLKQINSLRCQDSASVRNIPSWFPGMGIKKRAYETSVLREKMSQAFFDFVVQSKVGFISIRQLISCCRFVQALGTAKPSLVSQIIDNLNESKTDPAEVEQLGKDIGSFMYIGKYIRTRWNLRCITPRSTLAGVETVSHLVIDSVLISSLNTL